jgi:hypothetical protein
MMSYTVRNVGQSSKPKIVALTVGLCNTLHMIKAGSNILEEQLNDIIVLKLGSQAGGSEPVLGKARRGGDWAVTG